MNLISNRLILNEISKEDISLFHDLNSYEEVARYNTIGIPNDISDTEPFFLPVIQDMKNEERTVYHWVISNQNTDFIGGFGLRLAPKRFNSGEIYYNLHPKEWGKGYATEAAKCVLQFCFDTLKLHRISAGVAINNTGSIKVLEKIGMIREGMHRKILPLKEGWSDNFSYAILEEDWDGVNYK